MGSRSIGGSRVERHAGSSATKETTLRGQRPSVRHGNQFPNMFCRADNYSRGFDLTKLAMPPARKLAIVACMDARLTIEPMLGLKTGDAHIIRNAEGSSQKTWCAR